MPRKKIRGHKAGPVDDVLRRALEDAPSTHRLSIAAGVSPRNIRLFIRKDNTLTIETADKLLRALYGDGCYLVIRIATLDDAVRAARESSAR